jgi:D-xylose transport system substrate-binding protein
MACGLVFFTNPLSAESKTLTIAFLMPCSTCADRFEGQDKPLFTQAVRHLDPSAKVIANNAQGSSEAQINQAEAALSNGADVIMVSPLTEAAGAAIVDKAKAQHVPVVSYDGLITDDLQSNQTRGGGSSQGGNCPWTGS